MSQQLLSEDELQQWLNAEIQKHEECSDCRFGGIMRLLDTDESGCNWSEPMLRCSGKPVAICLPIANQVVAEARAKFNLNGSP